RARPETSDPFHVLPTERCLTESCVHVDERHRPLAWDDNVAQFGTASIKQEANQPSRACEQLWQKRDLVQWTTAQQLFHAVVEISFAHSRHRSIDSNNQSCEAGHSSSFDRPLGGSPSPH